MLTYDIICIEIGGFKMFDQKEYIKNYNKNAYKMYQFRIKKDDEELNKHLDNINNKNSYIVSLIKKDIDQKEIYTIKQIKDIIKPILNKHNINEIYLFGSYSRGEATKDSDIDIFCEKGDIRTLIDQGKLEDELELKLKKEVDLIFTSSNMDDFFKQEIEKDLIKLC